MSETTLPQPAAAPQRTARHDVLVVGAGFSGIGVSIGLSRDGFDDHLLLDEAEDVGGTWHWNRYPGVAVDIPTFSYQYSFAQRSDWSRVYAPGSELLRYAQDVAREHDVRRRTRFGVRVLSAAWDEDEAVWRLDLSDGTQVEGRHLVSATGVLSEPKRPAIEGLDDFAGPVVHTARWDDSLDLTGKRVAIIGTGASSVQLLPALADGACGPVASITVHQRTPIWCLPKPDAPLAGPAKAVLGSLPLVSPLVRRAARVASQSFVELTFPITAHFASLVPISKAGERIGHAHLDRAVEDPVTREKLRPQYALGCKRPSFSNTYLQAYNRDEVHLETDPVARITPTGVVVRREDGTEEELPVDVLVLATGFKVFERGALPTYTVAGRGGTDLEDWWDEHRYQAYEGTTVPGFPNLYLVLGPYGYNGSSYFTLIENQVRHILRCLVAARERGARTVEVTEEANARYLEHVRGRATRQVFRDPSCQGANSYYFNQHGDVPFRPSLTLEARWRSGRFPLSDYAFA